ncbi:MAG: hypothetical protein QM771_04940 [Nitrospira sp.]
MSLFIAEPDGAGKNPSALQRLNLQGTGAILSPSHQSYDQVKEWYLAQFPNDGCCSASATSPSGELQDE